MITRIGEIWRRLNASYWFYPGLFALTALILALGTIWLDRSGHTEWISNIPFIHTARPDGANTLLSVIASAMIGVAATVFSITIAAVAYASGNYGPRLLTNFMEDRGNQLSLATFIGTFVYAITVLRTVRGEDESAGFLMQGNDSLPGFVPQLSLLVAYALTAISIMVLVYFLNHIPASIRVNTVLEGIGQRLLRGIERRFPDEDRGDVPLSRPDGLPICAAGTGYVQFIDFDKLQSIASAKEAKLVLGLRPGDFVHPAIPLAFWSDPSSIEESPDDDIRDCFSLGGMRTPGQDIQFLIDELVEIGCRALSPGINDPFTAITAIHWLGAATAVIGMRDLRMHFQDDSGTSSDHLILLDDNYEHYLTRGFGALRSAVAANRIACLVTFDTLVNASLTLTNESRKARLKLEGDRLIDQAREALRGPALVDVEARYVRFCQKMDSQVLPSDPPDERQFLDAET
ncbi:DUF2254 domain-containing protein [Altericroceibacterium endophyticum]|uniref:DUF2254 domain-containing protein n=1 Tax=Altericroceibacterium endophyticum TaxID=1808508 RepID=A0A6I4T9E5_9SPHN|nr:DUF2254 domain-containing protein [Altericroceibacterium endophyticum]MXO66623.1 DUF2254 domain-containing protein [Altericroceibacterium endophyticum]